MCKYIVFFIRFLVGNIPAQLPSFSVVIRMQDISFGCALIYTRERFGTVSALVGNKKRTVRCHLDIPAGIQSSIIQHHRLQILA